MEWHAHSCSVSDEQVTQRTPNRVQARTAKRKLHQGHSGENDEPTTPTIGISDEKSTKRKRRNSSNSCTSSPSAFLKPALTERQQLALLLQMTDPHKQQQGQSPTVDVSPRDTPGKSKIHKRNERGETPLHTACIKGDSAAVLNLLEQGAEIDASDNAGWTPLHEACNHGHSDVVSILINKGANMNVRGMGGDTPLHDAVVNDHSQVVELLLSKGADPKMTNSNHQTPLDICKENSISLLLRKSLSTMNEESTTATVDDGSSGREDVFTDDSACTPKRVKSPMRVVRHTRTPPPSITIKVKKELVRRAETPPPCLKLLSSKVNATRVQGRQVIANSRGSFYSDLSSSESDSDGVDHARGRNRPEVCTETSMDSKPPTIGQQDGVPTVAAAKVEVDKEKEELINGIEESPDELLTDGKDSDSGGDNEQNVMSQEMADHQTLLSPPPDITIPVTTTCSLSTSPPHDVQVPITTESPPRDVPAVTAKSPPRDVPAVTTKSPHQDVPAVTTKSPPQDVPAVTTKSPPQDVPAVTTKSPRGVPAVTTKSPPQDVPAVTTKSPPLDVPAVTTESTPRGVSAVTTESRDVHVPAAVSLQKSPEESSNPSKSPQDDDAMPITIGLSKDDSSSLMEVDEPNEATPLSFTTTSSSTNVSSLIVSFGLELFKKNEVTKPVLLATNDEDKVHVHSSPKVAPVSSRNDEQTVEKVVNTKEPSLSPCVPSPSTISRSPITPAPPPLLSPLLIPTSTITSPRGSNRSSPTTPSFPLSPRVTCSVSVMSGKPKRVASIDEDVAPSLSMLTKDSTPVPPTSLDLIDDDDDDSVSTVVSFSTSLPIVFSSLGPSSLRSSRNGSPKKMSRSTSLTSLSPTLPPTNALATPTQSGSVSPVTLNPIPTPEPPSVKDDVIHEEELQPPPLKKPKNPLPGFGGLTTTPQSQESRKTSTSENVSPMNEDLSHLPPKRRIVRQVYKSNIITQRRSVPAMPPLVPHNYDSFLTSKHSYRSFSVPPPRFPKDVYPPLLPSQHKLFIDQEQERTTLLSTHLNEVDRLVVCFEQELTRAYQKATGPSSYPPVNACAVFIERLHQRSQLPSNPTSSAQSPLPLSNINHEQLLTSYVQDVWDKYHRCSELLASRHKMEVEALWLSQRQQWMEWNKDVTVSSLVLSHVPVAHTGTFPKYVR